MTHDLIDKASLIILSNSFFVRDLQQHFTKQMSGLNQNQERDDVEFGRSPILPLPENSSISHKDHEAGFEELLSSLFTKLVFNLEQDLKPYFEHLDTRLFLRRCVRSMVPAIKYDDVLGKPDFYGPLLLTLSLSSTLHFAFKKADPAPLDRHLATSLLLCFGSLVVASLVLDVVWQYSAVMSKQIPAKFGLDRAICVVGYSFFGPSIILFIDGRIWYVLFYILVICIEGGSALSFGAVAFRASQSQNPVIGICCTILHIIWLLNLRGLLNTFSSLVEDTGR